MKYSKEWITKGEIRRLFPNPEISSRDLLLMKVTYYGALKIGEALKSVREDYVLEPYSHILLRDQKTDKKNWEVQPIPAEIIGDVNRFCDDNGIKTQDIVFQSNWNRRILSKRTYMGESDSLSMNTFYLTLRRLFNSFLLSTILFREHFSRDIGFEENVDEDLGASFYS